MCLPVVQQTVPQANSPSAQDAVRTHAPLTHVSPAAQQTPPQSNLPSAQVTGTTHAPSRHRSPTLQQTAPHVTPETHSRVTAGAQTPSRQTSLSGTHPWPQAPQLNALLRRSTQKPRQSVSPEPA
jgi:hypothetical protein